MLDHFSVGYLSGAPQRVENTLLRIDGEFRNAPAPLLSICIATRQRNME
jgi:hypothetical protein